MFSYRNCAYRFTKSSQCYGNVTVDDGGNVAVDDAGDDVDEDDNDGCGGCGWLWVVEVIS